MARNDPLGSINTRRTSQRERARADQVKNPAGGYTFQVSDEDRLRRFLILGTTGGSYHIGEKELTQENAQVVLAWAKNDPRRLADIATEISVGGRAPKQNPAIFALAAAARTAVNAEDRTYALAKVGQVCRTGTTLFQFAQYAEQFGGWGKGMRKAVGRWYTEKPVDKVALQAVKYRQRNGWTHRDMLRLSHPDTEDPARKSLFDFMAGRPDYDSLPPIVRDYLDLTKAKSGKQAVEVIKRGNGVTWELVPTQLLSDANVWDALLDQGIPMGALVKQLPRLTNLGLTKSRRSDIVSQLSNAEAVHKARIHPVNVLLAQKTYATGHGTQAQSKTRWIPDWKIVDALDGTFYTAYGNVEPTGKRTLIALDLSYSMTHAAGGQPISCREVEGAVALVTVATEADVDVVGFTARGIGWSHPTLRHPRWRDNLAISELDISPRRRLDDVIGYVASQRAGGTDCALPVLWAQAQKRDYDTIVVCTDNETWAGSIHPHQALEDYRQARGIPTKMVVAAFEASEHTIADPNDPGTLDIVGLDSAVPNLIADFSRGLDS